MRIALVLLCDEVVQDQVNRLAWDCHVLHGCAIGVRRIPPHVSLKQPIEIGNSLNDLDVAISELGAFVARLEPQEIRFGEVSLWPGTLHFPVLESPWLRTAHHDLNQSLLWAPSLGKADFDGPEYSFHLTILSDHAEPTKLESCLDTARRVSIDPFIPCKVAVIAYDQDSDSGSWSYLQVKTFDLYPIAR